MGKSEYLNLVYMKAFADEVEKNAGLWSGALGGIKGLATGLGGAVKTIGGVFKRGIGNQARGQMLSKATGQVASTIRANPITSTAAAGAAGIGAATLGSKMFGGGNKQEAQTSSQYY
jgi:hypothetical protein